MRRNTIPTLILFALVLIVTGIGYHQTEIRHAAALQQIEDAERVSLMQEANVTRLLAVEASSSEQAELAVRKWRARYKVIPARMSTADIIHYLEGLTRIGFEQFDISLTGIESTSDFKYYTFNVSGTSRYQSLYDFVWHVENERDFYRINNLNVTYTDVHKKNNETDVEQWFPMVRFSFQLHAYFSGMEGMSAPASHVIEVPRDLFPSHQVAHNSFYPVIRSDLPPNHELLVEVERARLVSILGNEAVFEDARGSHRLREGDRVYLGHIIMIDPVNAAVRASLNKGGIIEVVNIHLGSGDQ